MNYVCLGLSYLGTSLHSLSRLLTVTYLADGVAYVIEDSSQGNLCVWPLFELAYSSNLAVYQHDVKTKMPDACATNTCMTHHVASHTSTTSIAQRVSRVTLTAAVLAELFVTRRKQWYRQRTRAPRRVRAAPSASKHNIQTC